MGRGNRTDREAGYGVRARGVCDAAVLRCVYPVRTHSFVELYQSAMRTAVYASGKACLEPKLGRAEPKMGSGERMVDEREEG